MAKAKRYTGSASSKFMLKGIFLYFMTIPLLLGTLFALLHGDVKTTLSSGIAFALFLLTASLARRGFAQEKHYHDSKLSKAPKLPYKTVSAFFLFIATFFTSISCTDNTFLLSLLLASTAFLGFYLYYGFDPRKDKVSTLHTSVNIDDLIEITQNARERIEQLKKLKHKLGDFVAKKHLETIIKETEEIIDAVEEDPNDLSRARKFFKVYLKRTEAITIEFVNNLNNGNIDEKMQTNYNRLLASVKETIKEQKAKLNDDDILRLDVQIEALTKQLHNEGV